MLTELFQHQKIAFDKIIKNDKNFIFWPRQYGKSTLISAYLEHFINNNYNQNILIVCDQIAFIKNCRNKINSDIGQLSIDKHRSDDLYFINDIFLKFCSIKQHKSTLSYIMSTLTPTLIIFDNIYLYNSYYNIEEFDMFLNTKFLYVSSFIDLRLIKLLDYNNDFYIDIIQPVDKINVNDNDSITYFVIKELNYKPDELLDFSGKIFQRKRKLRKLNQISGS
jgi:hypothetical protein